MSILVDLDWEVVLLLFFVGGVAGWFDTIAGGGGLVTVPALLMTGIPPDVAMATNKLQGSSGTLISSCYFIRKGWVKPSQNKLLILTTFLGSITGSALLLTTRSDFLQWIVPLLLFGAGCYFLFSPQMKDVEGKRRLPPMLFAFTVAPLLGFYDGFFGPGTGAFMSLGWVALQGYSAIKATSHTKLLNFTSNISSLTYFLIFGQIYWIWGVTMILGQVLGSTIAARMVITQGVKLIKPILVIVCFTVSFVYVLRVM